MGRRSERPDSPRIRGRGDPRSRPLRDPGSARAPLTLFDRLSFASFGFCAGALFGLLLCWLYDVGASSYLDRHEGLVHLSVAHWVLWTGGVFAILGFVLGDRVGDLFGNALSAVYEAESAWYYEPPFVLGAILTLLLLALGLYLASR